MYVTARASADNHVTEGSHAGDDGLLASTGSFQVAPASREMVMDTCGIFPFVRRPSTNAIASAPVPGSIAVRTMSPATGMRSPVAGWTGFCVAAGNETTRRGGVQVRPSSLDVWMK